MKKRISIVLATSIVLLSLYTGLVSYADTEDYIGCQRAVISAWDNLENEVDITKFNITTDRIETVYNNIIEKNSEYFYVIEELNYSYNSGTNMVTKLRFSYNGSKNEIAAKKRKFNAKVCDILSMIKSSWTPEQKCLFIHDYIASHTKYDVRVYNNEDYSDDIDIYTAYGALVNNKALCQGISRAFLLLAKIEGIEAYSVKSDALQHEWNMVKLNDNYYHIDITWDNPAYKDDYNKRVSIDGHIRHIYFLLSDTQMLASDHKDWVCEHTATDSTTYANGFWKNISNPIQMIDDNYYYLYSNKLIKRSIETDSQTSLFTLPSTNWKASNGIEYVWVGADTGSIASNNIDNFIVLNDANNIYIYNIENNTISVQHVYSGKGYIYGINIENNTLNYTIKNIDSKSKNIFTTGKTYEITLPDTNTVFGDINSDGQINVVDILSIRKYLSNSSDISIDENATDIFNDTLLNIKDSLMLQKIIVNK